MYAEKWGRWCFKHGDLHAGKELYLEIWHGISLLFTSSRASHESNIRWTKGEKNHLEKPTKNSPVNAFSEDRRRENRQMHFVDPSFSSPTLSSHNGLDR